MVDSRATVRARFLRAAALGTAREMSRDRSGRHRAAVVLAAQGPIVYCVAGQRGGIGRAVGDRQREQFAGLGVEVGDANSFTLLRAGAQDLHERLAVALVYNALHAIEWKPDDRVAERTQLAPALEIVAAP